MSKKVQLSPPWAIFYREVQALFGQDPQIHVVYDEEAETIKVYVDNAEKAELLAKLLPVQKMFGRVAVNLQVIPSDGKDLVTTVSDSDVFDAAAFEKVFEGNPVFSFATTFKNIFQTIVTYVLFTPSIAQFFADDISEYYGLKSMLYADIAKDVFDVDIFDGVYFCTDKIR